MSQAEEEPTVVPEKFLDSLKYWTGDNREVAEDLAWMIYDSTGKFSTQGVSEEFISDALSLI